MPNYSALHYAAKAEKANLLAQEAAEKAKEVRDSLEDIDISQCLRKTGDEVFQDGTLTIKGDNHPLVIEGMAGTSATGLQVKDSLGAGETDLEHYATGDRYGSRLANRTAAGNEGVLDLYTTTAGVSILDATGVSSVLVPTAAFGDTTNRAASTEFVTNAVLDKADADGSNFTAEAKETIVSWGIPDYSAVVGLSSFSGVYQIPVDALLFVAAYDNGNKFIATTDSQGSSNYLELAAQAGASSYNAASAIVPAGTYIKWVRNSGNGKVVYYPLKGVN